MSSELTWQKTILLVHNFTPDLGENVIFMCFSQFLPWRFWENVMFIIFFPIFDLKIFWENVMFIVFFPIFALKILGKCDFYVFFTIFALKILGK